MLKKILDTTKKVKGYENCSTTLKSESVKEENKSILGKRKVKKKKINKIKWNEKFITGNIQYHWENIFLLKIKQKRIKIIQAMKNIKKKVLQSILTAQWINKLNLSLWWRIKHALNIQSRWKLKIN